MLSPKSQWSNVSGPFVGDVSAGSRLVNLFPGLVTSKSSVTGSPTTSSAEVDAKSAAMAARASGIRTSILG